MSKILFSALGAISASVIFNLAIATFATTDVSSARANDNVIERPMGCLSERFNPDAYRKDGVGQCHANSALVFPQKPCQTFFDVLDANRKGAEKGMMGFMVQGLRKWLTDGLPADYNFDFSIDPARPITSFFAIEFRKHPLNQSLTFDATESSTSMKANSIVGDTALCDDENKFIQQEHNRETSPLRIAMVNLERLYQAACIENKNIVMLRSGP